jgi:hypothetical protein
MTCPCPSFRGPKAASKTNQAKRISPHLLPPSGEGQKKRMIWLLLRTCDAVLTGPARRCTSFTPLATFGSNFIGAHLGEIICEVARTFNCF